LGLVSVFSGILTVTDLNIFNGPAQTTKLGAGARITLGTPLNRALANDRKWRIVLKKSFFAMTENSQDRWCVSLAAM
jgi:hypothetical protein